MTETFLARIIRREQETNRPVEQMTPLSEVVAGMNKLMEQQEFEFKETCKAQNLDPTSKKIECTRFDGPEFVEARDGERLKGQINRVYQSMKDQQWRTLKQIAQLTGDPEASISAQLRHLRKERFGSHTVNKKHLGDGLYEYQLIPNLPSASSADVG